MSSSMEVSPHNARARRVKGGIWNEDVLPIVEWEAAEHRVVLPQDLQQALGIATPVLRWDKAKLAKVRRVHPEVNEILPAITEFMALWTFAGPSPARPAPGMCSFLVKERISLWFSLSDDAIVSTSCRCIGPGLSGLSNECVTETAKECGNGGSDACLGCISRGSPEKAWRSNFPTTGVTFQHNYTTPSNAPRATIEF